MTDRDPSQTTRCEWRAAGITGSGQLSLSPLNSSDADQTALLIKATQKVSGPSGPLYFVFRALQASRPCDPCALHSRKSKGAVKGRRCIGNCQQWQPSGELVPKASLSRHSLQSVLILTSHEMQTS